MGSVGRGAGKLLLFGEHAAVYGFPAVGLPLPSYTEAEINLSEAAEWRVEGVAKTASDGVRSVLTRLAGVGGLGGEVAIQSTVPQGLGFGSSSALCVALARAARRAVGGDPDGRSVWMEAHRAEQVFHGTPSGIDTGLSLLGGLYGFRPAPPALPEAAHLRGFPMALIVGAVRRRDGTAGLIAGLRARMEEGDRAVRHGITTLGRIAEGAIVVLDAEDPPGTGGHAGSRELAGLADRAQAELDRMGLGSPELTRVLELGRAAGALGGKLSGAGGGGAFYLLAESGRAAESVARELGRRAKEEGIALPGGVQPVEWYEPGGGHPPAAKPRKREVTWRASQRV